MDVPAVLSAALLVIDTVEAAGEASLEVERIKANRSLQASGESKNAHQDSQNDATRVGAREAVARARAAKLAWDAEVNNPREGIEYIHALVRTAERAIETALVAGNMSAQTGEAQNARQDVPNDATRTSDHNNGWYPCLEALVVIIAYFYFATTWCYNRFTRYCNKDGGNHWVHVLYFVVVTTMTIGYGDIYPFTSKTKFNTILLVLASMLISFMGHIVVDNFKSWFKKKFLTSLTDCQKQTILLVLSTVAVVLCILIGILGINLLEPSMTTLESFYLSILTLATVGYGDFHFTLKAGRLFAIPWILICQPIFSEASKFLVSSLIRFWRYLTVKLLAKWVKDKVFPILNELKAQFQNDWVPYVRECETVGTQIISPEFALNFHGTFFSEFDGLSTTRRMMNLTRIMGLSLSSPTWWCNQVPPY